MEKKLIKAVKNRPAIYDLKHPSYKNLKIRYQLWGEIAEIVGETQDRCRQRWKSLRERARREINAGKSTDWPYFESLLFLKDTFEAAGSISSFTEPSEVDENTDKKLFQFPEMIDETVPQMTTNHCDYFTINQQQLSPTPKSTHSPCPTPLPRRPSVSSACFHNNKRIKYNEDQEDLTKAVESLNKLLDNIQHKNYMNRDEESPMMLFFKNLYKRMEKKCTEEEEIELQKAFLDTYIMKIREFEIKRRM